jgi:hypothetical protein
VNLSLSEIGRRRGALVERAHNERVEIGRLLDSQRKRIHLADASVSLAKFVATKKHLLVVAALAFAVSQPRRLLRWGIRAWRLDRFVRKARRFFGV